MFARRKSRCSALSTGRAARPTRRFAPTSRSGFAGLAALVVPVVLVSACSSGGEDEGFESGRPRPTDDVTHDHSGESSALAPETLLAQDIASLGEGAAVGDEMPVWVGLNVCGRFLDIPVSGPLGGLSIDSTGLLTVAPAAGDDTGHEVTVSDVMELLDVDLKTGSVSLGDAWSPAELELGDETIAIANSTLTTGDTCGAGRDGIEQGEVQLWYYTPAAVDSGEDVRLVVTDPEDVPLVAPGSAITVAFAPVSSLPTLPPAALVG